MAVGGIDLHCPSLKFYGLGIEKSVLESKSLAHQRHSNGRNLSSLSTQLFHNNNIKVPHLLVLIELQSIVIL